MRIASIYLLESRVLRFTALLISLFILGCAETGMKMQLPEPLDMPVKEGSEDLAGKGEQGDTLSDKSNVLQIDFSLDETKSAQQQAGNALSGDKLLINADKMPLNQFIHTALNELLGFSLMVDPAIANRVDPVTLHVAKKVEPKILLGMVEETLQLFDVGLVSMPDGMKVVPSSQLKSYPPDLLKKGALLTGQRIITFIPLYYADPNETMAFSQSLFELGRYGTVIFNKRLSALMVIGELERVRRFQEFIQVLDNPSLEKKSIRLIEPTYWQAKELVEMLKELLLAQGIPVAKNIAGQGGVQFAVLDKINAIVLVSPKEQWTKFVTEAIKKIDTPAARGEGVSTFVYFVKNTRAEELGDILRRVLSHDESTATSEESGSVSERKEQPSDDIQQGKLKVISDLQRNALIFIGNSKDYKDVLGLLETLDIPARQVLIDVTVAEITLGNNMKLGTEWLLESSGGNNTLATLGGLDIGASGLNFVHINDIGDVRFKLNAWASTGDAKILSSPRLLAMDNELAKISVGTQIAILKEEVSDSQSVGDGSIGVLRTFTYVDTGVILHVTPLINEGGVVQLKLHQEVSEVLRTSINNTPPISKREVDTVLLAHSGQSIMIGGLITHTVSEASTKVPILGDIPLLGWLFKNTEMVDNSTELIILVTPYIINDNEDADYFTRTFREQLGWD